MQALFVQASPPQDEKQIICRHCITIQKIVFYEYLLYYLVHFIPQKMQLQFSGKFYTIKISPKTAFAILGGIK